MDQGKDHKLVITKGKAASLWLTSGDILAEDKMILYNTLV